MDTRPGRTAPEAYEILSTAMAGTLGALPAPVYEELAAILDRAVADTSSNTSGWMVFACEIASGSLAPASREHAAHPVWQEIAALASPVPAIGGIVLASHLAFVLRSRDGGTLRLLVKSDVELMRSLAALLMSEEQLTPSELRLLKQLLCGTGLSAAAQADGVGHETKRSQYKTLARKLGARSQAELTSRVLTHILFAPAAHGASDRTGETDVFIDLVEEFIVGARCFRLRSAQGIWHRFIDIGPISGRPIVKLHSQILPDLRAQDIALLESEGVRLIIPLRNGAMSGPVRGLDIDEHLDHACEGIDLARSHFCGETVDLLLCVSGCAYGVEYARRFPERVRSIAFLGACAHPTTGQGLAGRMRAGLLTLARTHWGLLTKALNFYGGRLSRPAALRRFLQRHYAVCTADLSVVEAEYASAHAGERARQYFMASLESLKHDYYHQAVPRWDVFPLGRFPAAFFHGADDFIHTPAAIGELAKAYGGLSVHLFPNAGQLLYHEHFEPMLSAYADFLARIDVDAAQ